MNATPTTPVRYEYSPATGLQVERIDGSAVDCAVPGFGPGTSWEDAHAFVAQAGGTLAIFTHPDDPEQDCDDEDEDEDEDDAEEVAGPRLRRWTLALGEVRLTREGDFLPDDPELAHPVGHYASTATDPELWVANVATDGIPTPDEVIEAWRAAGAPEGAPPELRRMTPVRHIPTGDLWGSTLAPGELVYPAAVNADGTVVIVTNWGSTRLNVPISLLRPAGPDEEEEE